MPWKQPAISKFVFLVPQVPVVERFVVVHGQIILNQFKHFPNKAVKASAFPASLRAALEMRRHLKLYASTAGSVSRAVNRNPMKVCRPTAGLALVRSLTCNIACCASE